MGLMHGISCVKVGADASPTYIPGLTTLSVNPGVNDEVRHNGGDADPLLAFGVSADPSVDWTTLSLHDTLALLTSHYIAVDSTHKCVAYLQQKQDTGFRVSGSSHKTWTVNKGMIIPTSLSVDQGGDATLSMRCNALWDATNAPIVEAGSVALPSNTLATVCTLGIVKIGGTAIDGITSWSLDFGVQFKSEPTDGEVWPKLGCAELMSPMITIRGINTGMLTAYGIEGSAASPVLLYLRKRAANGMLVAAATAEHISLTAYGRIQPGGPSASPGGNAENEIKIAVTKNGANALLAWGVNVAMS